MGRMKSVDPLWRQQEVAKAYVSEQKLIQKDEPDEAPQGKGLLLCIYRDPALDAEFGECSNGGLSANHTKVVVVGTQKNGEQVQWLEPSRQVVPTSDDAPPVILVQSASENYRPHLEPLDPVKLFGQPRLDVVPLHDRFVNARDYQKEGFMPD